MTSDDFLIGKDFLNRKQKIVDSVTGVRKSYTCYETGSTMKCNDLSVEKGGLKRKLQNVHSVTVAREP